MSQPCRSEVLDRARCLALLTEAGFGRVVYTVRAMPAVQPVRFVVRDDAVLFRVPTHSALFTALLDAVLAIEADWFDQDTGAGWFVTVLGRAKEVRDPGLLATLAGPPMPSRPNTTGDRWVRVPIESVTGRWLSGSPAE